MWQTTGNADVLHCFMSVHECGGRTPEHLLDKGRTLHTPRMPFHHKSTMNTRGRSTILLNSSSNWQINRWTVSWLLRPAHLSGFCGFVLCCKWWAFPGQSRTRRQSSRRAPSRPRAAHSLDSGCCWWFGPAAGNRGRVNQSECGLPGGYSALQGWCFLKHRCQHLHGLLLASYSTAHKPPPPLCE